MNKSVFISICIPTYKRPDQLIRLLSSLEGLECDDHEIVISENKSEFSNLIEKKVKDYVLNSTLNIKFVTNNKNIGFDANLRRLYSISNGEYIIYFGDDDEVIIDYFNLYIRFIEKNPSIGFFLRSWCTKMRDGSILTHNYYKEIKFFKPGIDTFVELVKRTVFISGFTFRRELIYDIENTSLDGLSIYQVYLFSEISLHHNVAYYNLPIVYNYEESFPFMGTSEMDSEFVNLPGYHVENDIQIVKNYITILNHIDKKNEIKIKDRVIRELSKYSFPIMSIHRDKGLLKFFNFVLTLTKLGYGKDIYFYVYFLMLSILGTKLSKNIIYGLLNRCLETTPKL
jgi:glycosyltransferase involved in cell wall biosynthesis